MKIRVRIEELVLEGLPGIDHHRIGSAVERELGRLLTEKGLPPRLSGAERIPTLDGESIERSPGERPEVMGQQVGGAVYKGFNR